MLFNTYQPWSRRAGFLMFLCACFFLISSELLAQTVKNTVAAGSWDVASNWSPSGVPSGSNTIVVNHPMTRSSNLTISAWSGTPTITINSGGSLTVTGNLTLEGGSMDFTVNGGLLDVSGTVTLQYGGADMSVDAGTFDANHLYVNSSYVHVASGAEVNLNSLLTGNNGTTNYENYGTTNISGNIDLQGRLNNYGELNAQGLSGNGSSSSILNNYGILNFSGDLTFPSSTKFYLNPGVSGSTCVVDGNVTVNGNENLVVGTSVAPPPYSDMVIKGNINVTGSGDIRVRRNGRLAVYGNVTADNNGGSFFTLDDGGQAFIGGDVTYPGGGDGIVNNNSGGAIGLYIDGVVDVASGNVGGQNSSGGYASSDYLRDDESGGDDNFYDWIATSEDSPLPVELLSFNASRNAGQNLLVWKTSAEIDNAFFTVEKSYDGLQYYETAQVTGAGNSKEVLAYSWAETDNHQGVIYYRLSQTDYDGTTEILGVKALNAEVAVAQFSVYPNLASAGQTLQFSGLVPAEMSIISTSGREVYVAEVQNGKFQLPAYLQSGVYILQTITDEHKLIQRIVVR